MFWLQLISYLLGVVIFTISNHRGAPSEPQDGHIYTQKTTVSLASLFLWLISGTPPKKWPHLPFLCINLSQTYLGLAYLPFPTIGGHIKAPKQPHVHPKNTVFPSIFVFVANIRYSTLKMTPITISLLQPISNLSGIGVSTIPNHWGPHQSPKTATLTPKKQLFS